jgi:hypothetical protein
MAGREFSRSPISRTITNIAASIPTKLWTDMLAGIGVAEDKAV